MLQQLEDLDFPQSCDRKLEDKEYSVSQVDLRVSDTLTLGLAGDLRVTNP